MSHFMLLSLVFPPDAVSTAQIMGNIAEDLAAAGHQVTVITTCPHYHCEANEKQRPPLAPTWNPLLKKSRLGEVEIWHIAMPQKSRSLALRAGAWAWYHAGTVIMALCVRRAHAILTCSPPLTNGVTGWIVGRVHRSPFIYSVQEMYPDIAIKLGVLRSPWLIEFLYSMERFIYRRAARVTAITPGMCRRIVDKGVESEKVVYLPNFVDANQLRQLPKDNAFTRQYDLTNLFVVSYAGNLGLAQDLETVLEAAAILVSEKDICFVLMGEGVQKEALARTVEKLKLPNVRFLPYQPFERMSEVYSGSDLNLVPLTRMAGGDALPSKVYRILACGRPILALADSDSDLAEFVIENDCGVVVAAGAPKALAEAVREAARNPTRLVERTCKRAPEIVARFTRSEITKRYEVLLSMVAKEGKQSSHGKRCRMKKRP